MDRITFSKDGPSYSAMAYGTMRILQGNDPQAINARLSLCADLGMTTIDTAEIYGPYAVEKALGAALALSPGLSERLEIVTKAGIYVPVPQAPERKVAFYDAGADQLVRSVETSLRLMRRERIELFLVHRPDWLTAASDTAEGLARLVDSGKVAEVGVSNYTPSQLAALNAHLPRPVVTNQVEFSLLHTDPMHDGIFDGCQQSGMRPMAWSPLGGGGLFDAASPAAQRLAAAAEEMAPRYNGASLDMLAYAWVMAHPARPVPVVGTNSMARIEAAAAAARITLDRPDWYALWTAAQGHPVP